MWGYQHAWPPDIPLLGALDLELVGLVYLVIFGVPCLGIRVLIMERDYTTLYSRPYVSLR